MANKKIKAKQLKNKNIDNKVIVQGREYEINMNLGVLAELEDIYGDVDKAMKSLQSKKIRPYIDFMYAIMIQEDGNEKLTRKEVGKMLDTDFISNLIGKTEVAMKNSFGEAEEKEDNLGE